MPTSDDEMAKTSSKSFCDNFLKAGGLRYKKKSIPVDALLCSIRDFPLFFLTSVFFTVWW